MDGCGQNRLAPDCASQWCRKHCIALYQGTCPSKKHKRPGADTTVPAYTTVVPPPATLIAPPVTHIPPPAAAVVQAPPAATIMPPSSSGPADPSDPPRFSSQLHPFFTEALARGAELREQKHREEVRRIASELRAKRTVKVFAWTKSGDPFACSFQNGFVWPYFNLSDDVLETVGLFNASEERKLELYDAKGFGYWTNVEAGHIIEVREGHSIFLRSKDAEVCRGLKEHLEEFRRSAPHFYGQLARDRQGVHAFFYDYEMGWDSELTPRERDASSYTIWFIFISIEPGFSTFSA